MTTNFNYLPLDVQKELKCIADTLVMPGKGILSADESSSKMEQRLQEIGLDNNEEIRRRWRQLLFSTDPQISTNISGAILVHETVYQKDENGKLLIEYLKERCIIPGIKVDGGLVNLYSTEEVTTQGLDNLENRLAQYKIDGCEFARWRCVFKIGKDSPSYQALITNANTIARYASICQFQRICPIIEPEVLPEGDYNIEECQKVTETVLSFVFRALHDHHVYLEGTILKPNMVTAGLSQDKADLKEIAYATITTLQRTVPPAVPGICFSSGGQTEEEATINLNAINQEEGVKPWKLTFAYGRALQISALRIWGGNNNQIQAAQEEFIRKAQENGNASLGQYNESELNINEDIISPMSISSPITFSESITEQSDLEEENDADFESPSTTSN